MKKKQLRKVIGIDHGNAFLRVAAVDVNDKNVSVLSDNLDRRSIPNVVFVDGDGDDGVSLKAGNEQGRKRIVDIKEKLKDCLEDDSGTNFLPEQVCAASFANIKSLFFSQDDITEEESRIILSVPGYYDEFARRALLDSAHIAGFKNVDGFCDETSALALAYAHLRKDLLPSQGRRRILFVDIGRTTAQLALAEFSIRDYDDNEDEDDIDNDRIRVRILGYDYSSENVGGRRFDRVLFQHFSNLSMTESITEGKLMSACETLKKKFSGSATSRFKLNIDEEDVGDPLSRSDFEELSSSIWKDFSNLINRFVERYSEYFDNEDVIVEITGGSTRIPKIREILETELNRPTRTSLHREEAISIGCVLDGLSMIEDTNFPIWNGKTRFVPRSIEVRFAKDVPALTLFDKGMLYEETGKITSETPFSSFVTKYVDGNRNEFIQLYQSTTTTTTRNSKQTSLQFYFDRFGILNLQTRGYTSTPRGGLPPQRLKELRLVQNRWDEIKRFEIEKSEILNHLEEELLKIAKFRKYRPYAEKMLNWLSEHDPTINELNEALVEVNRRKKFATSYRCRRQQNQYQPFRYFVNVAPSFDNNYYFY